MNDSNIVSAKAIIGDKVKNNEDQLIGELKELLVDPAQGKVEYGVVSVGGVMGVGAKQIAVPYEALVFHSEGYFSLNVDKETLDKATSTIDYNGKTYFIY